MTEAEVRDMLRQQISEAGSHAKWAHRRGFSDEYARQVANGARGLSGRFVGALGLRKVVSYEPIGCDDDGRSPATGADESGSTETDNGATNTSLGHAVDEAAPVADQHTKASS